MNDNGTLLYATGTEGTHTLEVMGGDLRIKEPFNTSVTGNSI
jgi:hypothetical protein